MPDEQRRQQKAEHAQRADAAQDPRRDRRRRRQRRVEQGEQVVGLDREKHEHRGERDQVLAGEPQQLRADRGAVAGQPGERGERDLRRDRR